MARQVNVCFCANIVHDISTKVGDAHEEYRWNCRFSRNRVDKKRDGRRNKQTFSLFFSEENAFEQVGRGIYASPEAWEDELYILSLRCQQGIISHDEALYHYGLIDREPLQPTITIYTGYGTSRLVKDGIKVFTVKKELLTVGKTFASTAFGHRVPMYNMERTICDLVRNRSWFEIQDYQTALQSYVRSSEKDLNRLMEYAKIFHIDKKMREYMEIML